MANIANFKAGYGREGQYGKWVQARGVGPNGNLKPYASKETILEQFQEDGYQLADDANVSDIRTDQNTGWHKAVGIIEDAEDEEETVYRYMRLDTYPNIDADEGTYKVWIYTEEPLPNAQAQLSQKIERLKELYPTGRNIIKQDEELGEELHRDDVPESDIGNWKGEFHVGRGSKNYDYEVQGAPGGKPRQQTLYET